MEADDHTARSRAEGLAEELEEAHALAAALEEQCADVRARLAAASKNEARAQQLLSDQSDALAEAETAAKSAVRF